MLFSNVSQYLINTGNILLLNDITKKSGLSSAEELNEAIEITIGECEKNHNPNSESKDVICVNRPNDDLKAKIAEHPISDLKIGFKIFLNKDSEELLREAIDKGFHALNVGCVHNVVISYQNNTITEPQDVTNSLKKIWAVLEEYVKKEKIFQIGLADVEESTFTDIYEWANVKPSIIQINLATCCVVPPTLQTFCKDNEVQLLTHSDPADILPKNSVENSCGVYIPTKWILRFLVHFKCRGVLATKGYLIRLGEH